MNKLSALFERPEKVFLWIAVIFGLSFLAVTPPASVPDEPMHLVRVFRVAQGDFFSSSQTKLPSLDAYCDLLDLVGMDRVPQALNAQFRRFLTEPAQPLTLQDYGSSYAPVPYLPAAAVVRLLSYATPNTAVYLYSARLATFVVALLLAYAAIQIIPFGRWSLLAVNLLPMRLYLMASFSPDAITTSLAMLWIALIAASCVDEKKLSPARLVSMGIVGAALAFTKPMFVFLLLLIVAVPLRKMTHYKKLLVCVGMLLVIVFVIKLVLIARTIDWNAIATPKPPAPAKDALAQGPAGSLYFLSSVNPTAQLALLIQHPCNLAKVLVHGYWLNGANIPKSSVGVFGWFNVFLENGLYWGAYVLLMLSAFVDGACRTDRRFRIVSLLLFMFALVLIPTLLYLGWTPVGATYFQGVHGRYYLPYLPLLLLALGSSWPYGQRGLFAARFVAVAGIVALLAVSISTLYAAYFRLPPAKGVLELEAKTDASGMMLVFVQDDDGITKRIKLKPVGTVSLIASDEFLKYEARLPAKPIRSIALVVLADGRLDLALHTAAIKTFDGKVVRSLPLWGAARACWPGPGTLFKEDVQHGLLTISVDRAHHAAALNCMDIPFNLSQH